MIDTPQVQATDGGMIDNHRSKSYRRWNDRHTTGPKATDGGMIDNHRSKSYRRWNDRHTTGPNPAGKVSRMEDKNGSTSVSTWTWQ